MNTATGMQHRESRPSCAFLCETRGKELESPTRPVYFYFQLLSINVTSSFAEYGQKTISCLACYPLEGGGATGSGGGQSLWPKPWLQCVGMQGPMLGHIV